MLQQHRGVRQNSTQANKTGTTVKTQGITQSKTADKGNQTGNKQKEGLACIHKRARTQRDTGETR